MQSCNYTFKVAKLQLSNLFFQSAYEEEKKHNYELISDMTRQYKSMREELLKKITDLEEEIILQRDKLGIQICLFFVTP